MFASNNRRRRSQPRTSLSKFRDDSDGPSKIWKYGPSLKILIFQIPTSWSSKNASPSWLFKCWGIRRVELRVLITCRYSPEPLAAKLPLRIAARFAARSTVTKGGEIENELNHFNEEKPSGFLPEKNAKNRVVRARAPQIQLNSLSRLAFFQSWAKKYRLLSVTRRRPRRLIWKR